MAVTRIDPVNRIEGHQAWEVDIDGTNHVTDAKVKRMMFRGWERILVGRDPRAPMEQVIAAGGAAWLLVGIAYPGNTGFAIRTAEVSGADGVFIDSDFEHEGRREAVRAAMRADHFMPVFWVPALPVVSASREAGRRVLAIEDVGNRAPWEMDLGGPVLFVVGGERNGIPAEVLAACDDVIRIPMLGFIPSYNLQAAMAAVACERLRQLKGG